MTLKPTEAFLITSKENIYYFSGIYSETGVFLLLGKKKKFVLTDKRFIDEAGRVAKGFIPIATEKNDPASWKNLLKSNHIKMIYFESYHLSYHYLTSFKKSSRGIARLAPSPVDLQETRAVKTGAEIAYIKKAVRITDKIMEEILNICKKKESFEKISEYDLAIEIHRQALMHGCDELSFSPIVAFGKNSGIPHHQPSPRRKLKKGDMILLDMGVRYNHYCADLTRSFFTQSPTDKQKNTYTKVLTAQNRAIAMIKQGVTTGDVYKTVADYFGADAPHFTHGLGHGVGLAIHELPNLKPESDMILKPGHVITIEPGLYYPWGGVRIEDIVLVTENGHQVLTRSPKHLQIIN